MPPANDNFSSAAVLTGQSGSTGLVYDNTGATLETGEPTANGRSIWFKWTCPAGKSDRYFFDTVGTAIATRLDAFTGSAVNSLTNVSGAQCYSGFNLQCKIVFLANEGTDYYIRVDGRNGAQGAVALVWGVHHSGLRLADCAQCCSTNSPNEHCAGTVEFSSANFSTRMDQSNRSLSFGTKPEGPYVVRTCSGAWRFTPDRPNTTTYDETWIVSRCPTSFTVGGTPAQYGPAGWFIFCHHSTVFGSGINAYIQEPVPTGTLTGTATAFESQAIAEEKTRCCEAGFYHKGGTISMDFYDDLYVDNVHGAGGKGPKYGLFKLDAVFQTVSICTSRQGSNQFTITFNVKNSIRAPMEGVNFTLALTGGIASATLTSGAAMPNITDFAAGQTKPVSFKYTCTTPGETFLSVTLQTVLQDGTVLADVTTAIRPILVTSTPNATTNTNCGAYTMANCTFRVTNNGGAATDALVATLTPLTNFSRWLASCVPVAGTTRSYNLFNLNGCGAAGNPVIQWERATAGASTFQVDYTDTVRTYPSAVISI